MQNNILMEQLNNPKNWKKTHKKAYDVYMCRPLPGTQCDNRLEGSHYVTDQNRQFIISGTVGETWVIDVNKLAKTYTFADGTPITPNTLKSKCKNDGQIDWTLITTKNSSTIKWAFHLPKYIQNFPVQTSSGITLYANRNGVGHLKGDFLVCSDLGGQPNLNDVWVVNGEIFPRTYDLHAFPNMFSIEDRELKTKSPEKSFITKQNTNTNNYTYNMYKYIKRLIVSGKYANIDTTSLGLEYNENENKLYAKVTEEAGKNKYVYTCEDNGEYIEIYRYKGNNKDTKIKLNKEAESIKLFMSILNIVNKESYNSIDCLNNCSRITRESFEAYSGDSISIDGSLANYRTEAVDKESAALRALYAYLMQNMYNNSNKQNAKKYDGYLFRGQGKMGSTFTDKGFLSLTTSIGVAGEFAQRPGSEILAITGIDCGLLVNMRNVAIYGIDIRESDTIEYEILANDNITITKGKKIGEMNGNDICLAKISRGKRVSAVNTFMNLYNYDSIYALKLLVDNIDKFSIVSDPFKAYEYVVRFADKSNEDIDINFDTSDIIVNNKKMTRKEFESLINKRYGKAINTIKDDSSSASEQVKTLKFLHEAISKTLVNRGYRVEVMVPFDEITDEDCEIFRVTKHESPNTVCIMTDGITLYDYDFEELSRTSIPSRKDKEECKALIKWIASNVR